MIGGGTEPAAPGTSLALVTCRRIPDLTPDDRLLLEPLAAAGIRPHPVAWDDPRADWTAFDAVLVRSPWDYHIRPVAFRSWIERCDASGVRLWNPAAVLRWNMHKRYLRDLARDGIPIVPTVWLDRAEPASLEAILEREGWSRAVVKPAISAGARRTRLVSIPQARSAQPLLLAMLGRGEVLVQPFLEQLVTEGEWSLVFLGGAFSHAVLKRPAEGDFRVQERFGGVAARAEAQPSLVWQAAAVLQALEDLWKPVGTSGDLLYARVDGVRDGERLLLVELEVLEPSLFLSLDPAAPERLTGAIAARLGSVRQGSSKPGSIWKATSDA